RAAQEDRWPGLARELGRQCAAHRGGLRAATRGEGRVLAALHAALEVPRGFAVTQQVERGGELHGAERRITIFAAPYGRTSIVSKPGGTTMSSVLASSTVATAPGLSQPASA